MRLLLLLITFAICYVVDPLPKSSVSTKSLMAVDTPHVVEYEKWFNYIRVFTYPIQKDTLLQL